MQGQAQTTARLPPYRGEGAISLRAGGLPGFLKSATRRLPFASRGESGSAAKAGAGTPPVARSARATHVTGAFRLDHPPSPDHQQPHIRSTLGSRSEVVATPSAVLEIASERTSLWRAECRGIHAGVESSLGLGGSRKAVGVVPVRQSPFCWLAGSASGARRPRVGVLITGNPVSSDFRLGSRPRGGVRRRGGIRRSRSMRVCARRPVRRWSVDGRGSSG